MAEEELEDLDDLTEARIPEGEFEPEQPAEEQQAPGTNAVDQVRDLKDQFDQGKEELAARRAKKEGAKGAKEGIKKAGQQGVRKGVEQDGVTAAKAGANKLAQSGAKTAATTGAKALGTTAVAGAEAAAGPAGWVLLATTILSSIKSFILPVVKKYWPRIVLILSFMLLLPTMVFGLMGLKGTNVTPTTATERAQATTVAALAGNLVAGKQVTQKNVEEIKTHYRDLVKLAKPEKKAEVEKRTNEIAVLLDQLVSLSGDPQKKLLAQIKEKEKFLTDNYSNLFAATGNCADLAPYIATGQFKVLSGPNGKWILEGKMMNGDGQLQPASQGLCKALLVGLNAGYKIATNTFSRGHGVNTVSNNRSLHWCGAAIDINYVNDKPVTDTSPDAIAISKLLFEANQSKSINIRELIVPSSYIQYEIKDGNPYQYGSTVQAVHSGRKAHIHLGGDLAPGACQ